MCVCVYVSHLHCFSHCFFIHSTEGEIKRRKSLLKELQSNARQLRKEISSDPVMHASSTESRAQLGLDGVRRRDESSRTALSAKDGVEGKDIESGNGEEDLMQVRATFHEKIQGVTSYLYILSLTASELSSHISASLI